MYRLLTGSYPVVPPDEMKCVWMTAGVLTYQLCDRQGDCEHCPLDLALNPFTRNRPAEPASTHTADPASGRPVEQVPAHPAEAHPGEPEEAPATSNPIPSSPLRRDRLYDRQGCWIMWTDRAVKGDPLVRVGLEPGFAGALRAPRSVIHTEPESVIQRGDTNVWITTEGGTFGIIAPLSGTMYEANGDLPENPGFLSARPMDEGWLYSLVIPARSVEFHALLSAGIAARLFDERTRRFQEALLHALREAGAVWPVLDNIDLMLQGVVDTLGPERYFALLREAYR